MAEQNETTSGIPVAAGLGLAAVILGGLAIVLAVGVGLASFAVRLPVYGEWYFLPVVAIAIVLGMAAARNAAGVAGAVLGVVAMLVCIGFIVVDRAYGPDIRAQLERPAAQAMPAGLNLEQLMKMSRPGAPVTQPAK